MQNSVYEMYGNITLRQCYLSEITLSKRGHFWFPEIRAMDLRISDFDLQTWAQDSQFAHHETLLHAKIQQII